MNLGMGQTKHNYRRDDDNMVRYGGEAARLVIPATTRGEVLEANHDYLLAGHGGVGKTYAKVSQA